MDYTIEYPKKNFAIIHATIAKEQWDKILSGAEASGISKANAEDFAKQNAALEIAKQAMATDGLKLSTAPVVYGEPDDKGDMQLTLECQLLPEVKLGQYTGFDVKAEVEPLTDEEINAEINRQLYSQKLWNTVEGPAENGDRAVIDFLGKKDGVPFAGGSAENYGLILGSGSFIPGFEEQVVGMKAGETKDIDVTFPEDYFEKSLAGAPVVFTVTVKEVQQEIKPELTDEFLKRLNLEGVQTVEAFKDRIAANLRGMKEQEADNRKVLQVLDKISTETEIDVPDSMLETHVQQHLQQLEMQLQPYQIGLEQYLEMTGSNLEQLKESIKPQAAMEIRHALILEAIAEKENILAENEELEQEYNLLASMYGMPAEQVKLMVPAGALATQIIQRKTMDFLKKNN